MKAVSRFRHIGLLWAAAVLLSPAPALACAICYGEPDSPMTRGLTLGILALVMIVMTVLGGVVAFFVRVVRNESASRPTNPPVRSRSNPK